MGGLGNKFFQIARAIELKNNDFNVEVIFIDHKFLNIYKLGGHIIHNEWLNISSLANSLELNIRPIRFFELISLGFKFFFRKLGVLIHFDEKMNDILMNKKNMFSSSWDIGYFQSQYHVSKKSLNKVADEIISLLKIQKNNNNEMVCHIRGGDFDSSVRLNNDDISKLVKFCKSNMLELIVVTNDKLFCETLFENKTYKLSSGKSAHEDFITLASSTNLYLSNSTFAFWAAFIAIRSHHAMALLPNNWSYSDFI